MDSNKHSEIIRKCEVQIEEKRSKNNLFTVSAKNKNLQLLKNKIISQDWSSWKKWELASNSTIRFNASGENTNLLMTNVSISEQHIKGIKNGWNDFYWTPWKSYLETRSKMK